MSGQLEPLIKVLFERNRGKEEVRDSVAFLSHYIPGMQKSGSSCEERQRENIVIGRRKGCWVLDGQQQASCMQKALANTQQVLPSLSDLSSLLGGSSFSCCEGSCSAVLGHSKYPLFSQSHAVMAQQRGGMRHRSSIWSALAPSQLVSILKGLSDRKVKY